MINFFIHIHLHGEMLESKPYKNNHAFLFSVLQIQSNGPQQSIYENRMIFCMKTYEHLRKSMKTYENL